MPVLWGASISGIWTGQTVDKNGDPLDVSFRFNQNGETLTGKMYGDNESTPIADGKIVGSQVTFTVTTELNGQISTFAYTGTITGDEMEVTRQRINFQPPPGTPANGTANPKPQNQKQTFRLKHLA